MASVVYPKFKQSQNDGNSVDLDDVATDVRAICVDTADYTYDPAHQFLSDVGAPARVAVSAAIQNKTLSATGLLDADPVTIAGVSGDRFEAVIFYVHTGTEGTSRLVSYHDSATGLPYTPIGEDVQIRYANGIAQL